MMMIGLWTEEKNKKKWGWWYLYLYLCLYLYCNWDDGTMISNKNKKHTKFDDDWEMGKTTEIYITITKKYKLWSCWYWWWYASEHDLSDNRKYENVKQIQKNLNDVDGEDDFAKYRLDSPTITTHIWKVTMMIGMKKIKWNQKQTQ